MGFQNQQKDRFTHRTDGRSEGPDQNLPTLPTDVLAPRPQGPNLNQCPCWTDEHGGKVAPRNGLWTCGRRFHGWSIQMWSLLRCQCLYRTSHPARRNWRISSRKNCKTSPTSTCWKHHRIQILLRFGLTLRTSLFEQGHRSWKWRKCVEVNWSAKIFSYKDFILDKKSAAQNQYSS